MAVVTGGATGLGRAVVMEFGKLGCNVAFCFVNLPGRDVVEQALLTETALAAMGVGVYAARCDVRDRDEVERFIGDAKQRLGGVHFLVNNAGIANDGALWRLSDEAWREVLDTNVTGAFNCIRAVAPIFRQQHYGKIVNVSAHQAKRPGFGVANYAASKAALLGLTRAAAVELGPANVNVNAVAPGLHPHRADGDAPVRGHRAGAEELGPRPGGGAGGRRPRGLVPLLRVGAAHHRADDRGGWGVVVE